MYPSVKRLAEWLDIDRETARRVRHLIDGTTDYREHRAVVSMAQRCYHDPRVNPNAEPECIMEAVNAEIEGYGVEGISGAYVDSYHGEIQATYVNRGDTYTGTLLYDNERGRYVLSTFGDFVEYLERNRRAA